MTRADPHSQPPPKVVSLKLAQMLDEVGVERMPRFPKLRPHQKRTIVKGLKVDVAAARERSSPASHKIAAGQVDRLVRHHIGRRRERTIHNALTGATFIDVALNRQD